MQCCKGLQHLLSSKVIHRDIKLDNILVKSWDSIFVVLADLNFFKKIETLENKTTLQTVLGTDGYMAPEIRNKDLRKNGVNYNYTIDVFALGVVAYELVTVKQQPSFKLPPKRINKAFEEAEGKKLTSQQILQKAKEEFHGEMLKDGVPLMPERMWERVSDEGKEIVGQMVLPVYTERPTYDQLLSSPWANLEFTGKTLHPIMDEA